MATEANTVSAAALSGFVEARTAERILGWAWDPTEPQRRVAVALRLDGQRVVESVADRPRDDLLRACIGDGSHAFELDVPAALAARSAELQVVAFERDGSETALATPQPAPGGAAVLSRLQRNVAEVMAGQRAILRSLQGGSEDAVAEDAIARLAELQARCAAQLEALEVFVLRLDARLAAMAPDVPPPTGSRGAMLVAGFAALGAAAALAMTLLSLA
jgi:hypothetical protein